jgi:predicted RNA-binding Zn ribbon-like protein
MSPPPSNTSQRSKPVSTEECNPQSCYGGVVRLADFLNTLDVDGGTDALADAASAAAWLAEQGRPPEVDDADLALARGVRAALRGELGEPPAPMPEVPVRVVLAEDGPCLAGGGTPLQTVIGEALAEAVALQATGEWSRVKTCALDSCRWVFFDESRNRSGRWCSMQGCGNKAKTAAYRARHRHQG